jgi:hypothetical protein
MLCYICVQDTLEIIFRNTARFNFAFFIHFAIYFLHNFAFGSFSGKTWLAMAWLNSKMCLVGVRVIGCSVVYFWFQVDTTVPSLFIRLQRFRPCIWFRIFVKIIFEDVDGVFFRF